VLIGPNGCGKTTLLHCLNGTSQVTSGEILLDNQNFLQFSSKERARKISFLPQVRSIIPAIPARMLVEHGRFPYLGFSRKKTEEDKRIVEHALSFTHTTPYADQSTDTLSGGIRQRVFFAMTLAQDCDYLVLDEPTTYLDPDGQKDILSLIQELKAQGKTIIVTLHDLSQAIRIADRLIIMDDRRIIAQSTPEECLKRHIIQDVFHVSCKQFQDEEGIYYFFQ
ncbi:MAG: ABC transporter ATP-binding protein, partial [Lachnospiraceae bacterium]|nr:ABC transporter ATP-binding protein [Lachnospiraceae bacterium]